MPIAVVAYTDSNLTVPNDTKLDPSLDRIPVPVSSVMFH
jgi:hypothetical protein